MIPAVTPVRRHAFFKAVDPFGNNEKVKIITASFCNNRSILADALISSINITVQTSRAELFTSMPWIPDSHIISPENPVFRRKNPMYSNSITLKGACLMINSYSISYEDLRQRILTAENIDREQKEYLLGILDGKLIGGSYHIT